MMPGLLKKDNYNDGTKSMESSTFTLEYQNGVRMEVQTLKIDREGGEFQYKVTSHTIEAL